MHIAVIASLILLLGSISAESKVSFENYKVFSVNVSNEAQSKVLQELEADGFEFWRSASAIGGSSDIMVAPYQMDKFAELTQAVGLKSRLMVENVQR